MAYSIYQTDAVILGIQHIQEHDLMLRVFSPVFGYIRVIAKGARKGASKLRANMQEYAVVHIAAVKGKEFFILTDARRIFSFIQSRSIVSFLKQAEGLFFADENDHGMQVSADIYHMLLRICKLIVWMVSEKKDLTEILLIQDFFSMYVKGLQGFVHKIDVTSFTEMTDIELYIAISEKENEIEKLKGKLQEELG